MTLYLGVDGGGTGCRVRLVDAAGATLAEATAGPANISSAPEGALANILAATRAALAAVPGCAAEDLRVGLGLAGANAAGTVDWLAERLPFAAARIETDAVSTTLGALGSQDGIVAAIGTGSVFADSRGGVIRQIGGWGFTLGDAGSGAVLGRMLLSRALLAQDGLVAMTPLLSAVLADFGAPEAMVSYAVTASPGDFATHARRLVAATDDPAARAILAEAATGVAEYVERLQRDGALPVAWVGGLGRIWQDRIGDRWPQAAAQGSSLDGAVRLALSLAP